MNDRTANLFHDMTLNDGQVVRIRPITGGDAQIEWDFVHNLSSQSRYYRFLGGLKDLSPKMVDYFTKIDLTKNMALIATIGRTDNREKEIAVGRYFVLENTLKCEFAIVVDDQWQGKGIGYQIMRMLIADAKTKGIELMEGPILSENHTMIEMIKSHGFSIEKDQNDHTILKAVLKI